MKILNDMPLQQLRELLSEVPWFSLAYIELAKRVSPVGSESVPEMEKAALNVWSRAVLYEMTRASAGKKDFTDADITESIREELSRAMQATEMEARHRDGQEKNAPAGSDRKVVVIGGDYFSREDLDSLRPEDRIFSFLGRNGAESGDEDDGGTRAVADKPFDDMRFYTETLAEIYADQGYFDRADDVNSKLILLYPEKSAYFASLIEKLKQ